MPIKERVKSGVAGCRRVASWAVDVGREARLVRVVGFLFCVQLLGLLLLSAFRVGLYVTCHDFLAPASRGAIGLQAMAFAVGVWFDNVVACAIVVVPLVVLWLSAAAGVGGRRLMGWAVAWVEVLYVLAFAASASDIPYFRYFNVHLNSTIWNWAAYGGETLGMIAGERSYYVPMAAFVVVVVVFVWLVGRMRRGFGVEAFAGSSGRGRVCSLVVGLLAVGLAVFGIRGRDGREPINAAAAYYCDDVFLDRLGLNPMYFLIRTSVDDMKKRAVDLMPADEATSVAARLLGREGSDWSPMTYAYRPADDSLRFGGYNVVFVLMESMSEALRHRGLTPYLDSLETRSVYFDNCWSAGTHTSIGLYATLYSWPGILKNNLMKDSNAPRYTGLPNVLKDNGYETVFFMTHDQQYDNMSAFFYSNGFEELHSREDYPSEAMANCWGVRDDFLFSYALDVLDVKARSERPFFATILTISNHPPYSVPADFEAHSESDETRIVEYADWSLRQFFEGAQRREWYDRTLFVVLADHGKIWGETENVNPPSCFNHIPLMLLLPGVEPRTCHQFVTQMDVQPTVLGLLDIEAQQNNFGLDVFQHRRPYAFYCSDDVICCRDSNALLTYQPGTNMELLYRDGQPVKASDSQFDAMREYVFSMLQAAQKLVGEKRCGPPDPL